MIMYRVSEPLTWDLMKKLEPRLRALETLVLAVRSDPSSGTPVCMSAVWYGGAKPLMARLVGWERNTAPDVTDPNQVPAWEFEVDETDLEALPEERRIPEGSTWEAVLMGSIAYEIAYRTLYEMLPACGKGCWCRDGFLGY